MVVSTIPESRFPITGMVVSLLRNTGSLSSEWWLSKSGQVAQSESEYSDRETQLFFERSDQAKIKKQSEEIAKLSDEIAKLKTLLQKHNISL